jgi:hypothetical protein
MTISLAAELLVAVLLAATIGFCFVLNRRLGNLRASQDEMRQLIGDFDRAIGEARRGIDGLKAAGDQADVKLQERIRQARTLADELSFLVGRGEKVAERLAGERPAAPSRGAVAPVADDTDKTLRSEAERELAQALRRAR